MTEDEINDKARGFIDAQPSSRVIMLSGMESDDVAAVVKRADYLRRAKIWKYHPATGELLGADIADPDPLTEGEFLYPAFSTVIAPGGPQPGRAWRFNQYSVWENVADCRGEVWWDVVDVNKSVTIDFIGDPSHRGLTNIAPPPPPALSAPVVSATVSPRQIRLALNRAGLRVAFETQAANSTQDFKDTWQFASKFERNGVVNDVLLAMGKTPAEIDALFEIAKTL